MDDHKTIFWHRDLPPLDTEAVAELVIEADSCRVQGTLEHRSELWAHCYADLMARLGERLDQEVARLGGDCAHVLDESTTSKHDDATGEVWLHGRLTCSLLRRQRG